MTAKDGATGSPSPLAAPVRPGRGRRPAEVVERDVLAAAARLLLAEGLASFTVEKVAVASGASRVTIHKWWPSRGALALDAYFAHVDAWMRFVETGDIEADLERHLRKFVRHLQDTPAGRIISQLIGLAQTDPLLAAELRERYLRPRRALVAETLERARRAGRLAPDADPQTMVDQLWGACYFRLLAPTEELTEEFASRLVRSIMHGVAGPAGEQAHSFEASDQA